MKSSLFVLLFVITNVFASSYGVYNSELRINLESSAIVSGQDNTLKIVVSDTWNQEFPAPGVSTDAGTLTWNMDPSLPLIIYDTVANGSISFQDVVVNANTSVSVGLDWSVYLNGTILINSKSFSVFAGHVRSFQRSNITCTRDDSLISLTADGRQLDQWAMEINGIIHTPGDVSLNGKTGTLGNSVYGVYLHYDLVVNVRNLDIEGFVTNETQGIPPINPTTTTSTTLTTTTTMTTSISITSSSSEVSSSISSTKVSTSSSLSSSSQVSSMKSTANSATTASSSSVVSTSSSNSPAPSSSSSVVLSSSSSVVLSSSSSVVLSSSSSVVLSSSSIIPSSSTKILSSSSSVVPSSSSKVPSSSTNIQLSTSLSTSQVPTSLSSSQVPSSSQAVSSSISQAPSSSASTIISTSPTPSPVIAVRPGVPPEAIDLATPAPSSATVVLVPTFTRVASTITSGTRVLVTTKVVYTEVSVQTVIADPGLATSTTNPTPPTPVPYDPQNVQVVVDLTSSSGPFAAILVRQVKVVSPNQDYLLIDDGSPTNLPVNVSADIEFSTDGMKATITVKFVPNTCNDVTTCLLQPGQPAIAWNVQIGTRIYRVQGSRERSFTSSYVDTTLSAPFAASLPNSSTTKTTIHTTKKATTTKTTKKTSTTKTTSTKKTSTKLATTTTMPRILPTVYAEYCAPGKKYHNKKNCCCAPPRTITKKLHAREEDLVDYNLEQRQVAEQHLCPVCVAGKSGPCCPAKRKTVTKWI